MTKIPNYPVITTVVVWGAPGDEAKFATLQDPLPVQVAGVDAVIMPESLADGADATQGAKADAAWNGLTASPSIVSMIKRLSADPATQTTLAAILAKLLAAPATEAKQDVTHTDLAAILAKLIAAPATAANQATEIASLASIDGKTQANRDAASGVTAVTGSFVATGQSASFTPVSGRDFNVTARGTFVGSLQLERSFDGANWHPLTALGTQIGIWTAPFSEIFAEPQYGVLYRLNCTSYTSGTVTYRISQ